MRFLSFLTFFLSSLLLFSPPLMSKSKSPLAESHRSEGKAYYHYTLSQFLLGEGRVSEAIAEYKKTIKEDTNSAFLHAELATLYIRKGMMKEAMEELRDSLNIEEYGKSHLLLGDIYSVLGDNRKAIREYQRGQELEPDDLRACIMSLTLYKDDLELDKAIEMLTSYVKKNPDSAIANFYLGRAYAMKGSYLMAEQYLLRAVSIRSFFYDALLDLGLIYELLQRPEGAVNAYMKAIKLRPMNKELKERVGLLSNTERQDNAVIENKIIGHFRENDPIDSMTKIGLYYLEKGRFNDAVIQFNLILFAKPDRHKIRYYLATTYEEKGEYESALQEFKRLLHNTPYYRQALVHIGNIGKITNKIEEAISYMERAAEDRKDIDAYKVIANIYKSIGRHEDAIITIKKALRVRPEDPVLYFTLGVLYDEADNENSFIEAMKMAIKLKPDFARALNYLGYAYAEKGILLDEAEKLVRSALEIEPKSGYIFDSLGWIYYKRGDYKKAIILLEKANEYTPNSPIILEHLGDAYDKVGNKKRALIFYERSYLIKNRKDIIEKIETAREGLKK